MSIDSRIKEALSPTGLDVEADVYTGKNPVHYVFNYDTIGLDFADDAPEHDRVLIQIHLYAPTSVKVLHLIKRTKFLLWSAGFTWPTMTGSSDGNDRHLVFECEDAEGVDADGDA